MMRCLLIALSILATVGVLAHGPPPEEGPPFNIEVTHKVECDRKTKAGDRVEVHYRGTLASNGEQFDASYDRGKPFSFRLGSGQVIKGWDEGLQDMCIGEKRTLTIPPKLGYGFNAMGPIPAGSTLIFETELMGIDGVTHEDL